MAKHYLVSVYRLDWDKVAHSLEEAESIKGQIEQGMGAESYRVEIEEAAWLDRECSECSQA